MQKLSVSKWLSANIFIWGGVTMALAACTRFQPFLGLRFVLGALESCSTPAYLLITATWYTIEEQPIRIGWWSTFLGIANAFGGLLAFAIGHIQGNLASWQYQFIIIGAISSAWGAFMFFTLADGPSTAYGLSPLSRSISLLMKQSLAQCRREICCHPPSRSPPLRHQGVRDQMVPDMGSRDRSEDMVLLPLWRLHASRQRSGE